MRGLYSYRCYNEKAGRKKRGESYCLNYSRVLVVALVMSDDVTMEQRNKSNKVQEKSSNIDELLMEVEKKSIDADSDDDMGLIMLLNTGYSRRMSATSSEHSSIARRSDVRFNNILRNKAECSTVLGQQSPYKLRLWLMMKITFIKSYRNYLKLSVPKDMIH